MGLGAGATCRAAGRGGQWPWGDAGWESGPGPALPLLRGQQLLGLHQAEHWQRAEDEEGDPSLQLSTGEVCLNCWVPSTERFEHYGAGPSEGPLRCLRDSSSDIPDQPVESCGSAWTWSLIHMYKHLREGVQRRWGWTLLYELPREVVRSQSLVEDHHPMTLIWAGGLVSLS